MGYVVNDADGFLGDLCTTRGMSELQRYVASRGRKARNLSQFLQVGAALCTEVLEGEIATAKPKNRNVAATLANLAKLFTEARLVMIINDGVND